MAQQKKKSVLRKAAEAVEHIIHHEHQQEENMDLDVDAIIDDLDVESVPEEKQNPKQEQIKKGLHPKFHKFIK